MTSKPKQRHDPLTAACNAISIVIALNKPVYPLYVWYLAEDALRISLLTMISLPVFAALPFLARNSEKYARIGLVAVGTIDTVFITAILGEATGTWLFLLPCITLAAVSFYENEKWLSRFLVAAVFATFFAIFSIFPLPGVSLPPEQVRNLYVLNVIGAGSLAAFISLRFPLRPSG